MMNYQLPEEMKRLVINECEHPPEQLFSWFARDDTVKDGQVLVTSCKECGEVLSGEYVPDKEN